MCIRDRTRESVVPQGKQRDLKDVTRETNTTRSSWCQGEFNLYTEVWATVPGGEFERLDRRLAVRKASCGEGGERFVYRALFLAPDSNKVLAAKIVKESKFVMKSNAENAEFHSKCRTVHSIAGKLATTFNSLTKGEEPCSDIRFVEGTVLQCSQEPHGPRKWFFLEELLEGDYLKWNNNNGYVRADWSPSKPAKQFGLVKRHEDADVPQAFSHWSFRWSRGRMLVCDLQGVFRNSEFVLTDPVIHSTKKGQYGRTDRGQKGIDNFFLTHTCNALCQALGLKDTEQQDAKHSSSSLGCPGESTSSIRTSLVSVEPLPHCAQRMGERAIAKQQLQSARKHGTMELQHNDRRMYEHKGVVYITDPSGRKGVTAYKRVGRRLSVLGASPYAWAVVVSPHTGFSCLLYTSPSPRDS
eukprot:TRINITY_DN7907_c0_g2_i1.p1 TRINITY_DN7907_c0_g2~~TRINITY_DN7907_c0_g2_i1.p1  ORF type:complete len:412 (-),score=30.26 TRINITY_DN7907_c0_g2_i1:90-1325(-)